MEAPSRRTMHKKKRSSVVKLARTMIGMAVVGMLVFDFIMANSIFENDVERAQKLKLSSSINLATKNNTRHQLQVLMDITPSLGGRMYMFCAATYDKTSNQYLALASHRPAENGMTSYRLDNDWSIIPSSEQIISSVDNWEDPRLLTMDIAPGERIVLAFFQQYGKPFTVARWFANNNTIGPISELGIKQDDGFIVQEGTKNWSPLVYDGVLHFLISSFPTIVVRCETPDFLTWDVCVPSGRSMTSLGSLQEFQRAMVFRGGSNFIPYPKEGSNIFLGFLHSRTNENQCSVLGEFEFLHVPILLIIVRADDGTWHPVYLSHAPDFLVGHNMSATLRSLMFHHIQDPVSLARYDCKSGDIFLTLNMADTAGRCALGVYRNLLPLPSETGESDWVLSAAKNYKLYNATLAYQESFDSLMDLCQARYH